MLESLEASSVYQNARMKLHTKPAFPWTMQDSSGGARPPIPVPLLIR